MEHLGYDLTPIWVSWCLPYEGLAVELYSTRPFISLLSAGSGSSGSPLASTSSGMERRQEAAPGYCWATQEGQAPFQASNDANLFQTVLDVLTALQLAPLRL